MQRLTLCASSVVLRRDLSLNRRLYAWLLGPHSDTAYFSQFGLHPLAQSLKALLFKQGHLQPDPVRTSKISVALLDKWEIGTRVIPELFSAFMGFVFANPEASYLASARELFDTMDPTAIWVELFSWIESGRVIMLIWVVDNFDIRVEEMLVQHIPQVLLHILCLLPHKLLFGTQWFTLFRKLVNVLPLRAFASSKGAELGPELADVEVSTFVREYYRKIKSNPGVDSEIPQSLKGTYVHRHLLKILKMLSEDSWSFEVDDILEWTTLLKEAADFIPPLPQFSLEGVVERLCRYLNETCNFRLLGTVIQTTIALVRNDHVNAESLATTSVPSVFIHLLWTHLNATNIVHYVESVGHIWSLTSTFSPPFVEDLLAIEMEMSSSTGNQKTDSCERFTVLWKHGVDKTGAVAVLTRPMMIVLRFLKDEEGSEGRVSVKRWLNNLGNGAHR